MLVWQLSQLVYWGTSATPLPTMPGRSWSNRTLAYRDNWQFAAATHKRQMERSDASRHETSPGGDGSPRWRLGNSPLRILRLTAFMFVFFAGFQWLGIRTVANAQAAVRGMLPMTVMFVVSQIGMQVGVLWRTRLATLVA